MCFYLRSWSFGYCFVFWQRSDPITLWHVDETPWHVGTIPLIAVADVFAFQIATVHENTVPNGV
jgi:hypothetical protein